MARKRILGSQAMQALYTGLALLLLQACTSLPQVSSKVDLVGEFADIPAGPLQMGDQFTEGLRDERPVHQVKIRAFRLARTEVTRGQFAAFVSATGYKTDAERNAGDKPGCFVDASDGSAGYQPTYSWRDPGHEQTDANPVVCVSWNDAQAFIKWLAKKTGRRLRLPSEAEWEYAARAGSTLRYPWGMDANEGCQYANGADLTSGQHNWDEKLDCSDGHFFTAAVGSYRPNDFGLHDMIGNAQEWVQDCFTGNYNGAPNDGTARTDGDCTIHSLRGGAWYSDASGLRIAARGRYATENRICGLGFRLAEDR